VRPEYRHAFIVFNTLCFATATIVTANAAHCYVTRTFPTLHVLLRSRAFTLFQTTGIILDVRIPMQFNMLLKPNSNIG